MALSLDKYWDKICAPRKANGDPCESPALRGDLKRANRCFLRYATSVLLTPPPLFL